MILNKQTKVRLAKRPLQEFLRKAQRELQIADAEITVAFVSDAEIARWNEQYRHKQGPTDVLSFPAVAGAKTAAGKNGAPASRRADSYAPRSTRHSPRATRHASLFFGDIAIAPETAKRYSRKNGRTLSKELRVLILHGVLHLMGYDHECDAGEMKRIEQRLRRRLGVA